MGGHQSNAKDIFQLLDDDEFGVVAVSKLKRLVDSMRDDKYRRVWHDMLGNVKRDTIGFKDLQDLFSKSKIGKTERHNLLMGLEERRRDIIRKSGSKDWLNLSKRRSWRKELLRKSNCYTETVLFSGFIAKVSRRQHKHGRVAVITSRAVYILIPKTFECRRRIQLDKISRVSVSTKSLERVLHVPSTYDARIEEKNGNEGFLETLQDAYKNLLKPLFLRIDYLSTSKLHEVTTYRAQRQTRRTRAATAPRTLEMSQNSAMSHGVSNADLSDAGSRARSRSNSRGPPSANESFPTMSMQLKINDIKHRRGSFVGTNQKNRRRSLLLGEGGASHLPLFVPMNALRQMVEYAFGSGYTRMHNFIYITVEGNGKRIGWLATQGQRGMPEDEIWLPKVLQRRMGTVPGQTISVNLMDLRKTPSVVVYPFDDMMERNIDEILRVKRKASSTRRLSFRGSGAVNTEPDGLDHSLHAGLPQRRPASPALHGARDEHIKQFHTSLAREILPLLVNTKGARWAYRNAFIDCHKIRHWSRWISMNEILRQAFASSGSEFDPRAMGAFQLPEDFHPGPRSSNSEMGGHSGTTNGSKSTRSLLPFDVKPKEVRLAYLTFNGTDPMRRLNLSVHVANNPHVTGFRIKQRNQQRFSPLTSWAADACHEKQFRCLTHIRTLLDSLCFGDEDRPIELVEDYIGYLGAHFIQEAEWSVIGHDMEITASLVSVPNPQLFPRWESKSYLPLEFYTYLWQQDAVVISLEDCDAAARPDCIKRWRTWIKKMCSRKLCKALLILITPDDSEDTIPGSPSSYVSHVTTATTKTLGKSKSFVLSSANPAGSSTVNSLPLPKRRLSHSKSIPGALDHLADCKPPDMLPAEGLFKAAVSTNDHPSRTPPRAQRQRTHPVVSKYPDALEIRKAAILTSHAHASAFQLPSLTRSQSTHPLFESKPETSIDVIAQDGSKPLDSRVTSSHTFDISKNSSSGLAFLEGPIKSTTPNSNNPPAPDENSTKVRSERKGIIDKRLTFQNLPVSTPPQNIESEHSIRRGGGASNHCRHRSTSTTLAAGSPSPQYKSIGANQVASSLSNGLDHASSTFLTGTTAINAVNSGPSSARTSGQLVEPVFPIQSLEKDTVNAEHVLPTGTPPRHASRLRKYSESIKQQRSRSNSRTGRNSRPLRLILSTCRSTGIPIEIVEVINGGCGVPTDSKEDGQNQHDQNRAYENKEAKEEQKRNSNSTTSGQASRPSYVDRSNRDRMSWGWEKEETKEDHRSSVGDVKDIDSYFWTALESVIAMRSGNPLSSLARLGSP